MNSFTQSIPYVSCPSVFSDDFKVYRTLFSLMILWISSDIAFLTIPCVTHDFISGIDLMRRSWIHWRCDSMRSLSLSIHWRFQGLQLLCFGRRFIDQPWHSVFENSMRQPWLYFCYWLDASFVNSVTLLIPYVGWHSVFIDGFKVYSDYVFGDDL